MEPRACPNMDGIGGPICRPFWLVFFVLTSVTSLKLLQLQLSETLVEMAMPPVNPVLQRVA